jgi:hypothetical protein
MPVVFSVIFKLLFEKQCPDTDKLIEVQVDLLIAHVQVDLLIAHLKGEPE